MTLPVEPKRPAKKARMCSSDTEEQPSANQALPPPAATVSQPISNPQAPLTPISTTVNLKLQFPDIDDVCVLMKLHTPMSKLYNHVAKVWGKKPEDFSLFFDERRLLSAYKLSDFGSAEDLMDSTITVIQEQKGGKPVIYLFPPTLLETVNVKLSLVPAWTFSALYPLSAITKSQDGGTATQWTVSASPSGDLVELSSSLKLTYLFWEAITNPLSTLPPSPPLLAIDDNGNHKQLSEFNPSRPVFDSTNTLVLPFTTFLSCLDDTLSRISLHTSARNDFITYWLPKFIHIHERGQKIAMRFVNQVKFATSARLEVEPLPDVVTRVFMLFGGVEDDKLGWEDRKEDVKEFDWVKIVGVKDKAYCSTAYRVLEWGGMEVDDVC